VGTIEEDLTITKRPCPNRDGITVFVGSNSGGKSAIFDALINFSMVKVKPLAHAISLAIACARGEDA
jgi:AAA15 family ATPase/GTPase